MTEPERGTLVAEGRVSTGTDAIDVMLHGGFLAKRPYLVVGPSGTGKTTLALQFLCDGVRRGEKCLIVTLEEPPNEIRLNHRSLLPELDQVYVFDAIPDVMRYERAPFKDIAAVRQSVPFAQVPAEIRKTPELSSVEVTFTALEQTLKMEMARRGFQRIVIDSLTALQYFCMKGFDETLGAQTFLRFLSDLRVTTVLTVEAPLEDSETPERLLARGEIRLFRWEHDARTVRALGVEKFRGSEHDARLHPYRISPKGLDINLALTISRDTQELLPSTSEALVARQEPPEPPEVFATSLSSLEQDSRDLVSVGVDVGAIRSTVLEAIAASERSTAEEVARIIARARGRVLEMVARLAEGPAVDGSTKETPAMRRLRARLAAARMGIPPSGPPDLQTLRPMLERILDALEPTAPAAGPGSTGPRRDTPTRATSRTPLSEPAGGGPPVPGAPIPPAPPTPVPSVSPTPAPEPTIGPAPEPPTGLPPETSRTPQGPAVPGPPPLPSVSGGSPRGLAPSGLGPSTEVGPRAGAGGPSPPKRSVDLPPAPSGEAAPAPRGRRKKAASGSTAPRKRAPRAAKAPAPPEVALAPAGEVPLPAGAAPPLDAAAAPTDAPAPKPKRRPSRRKAPPVTAAEAGSPPPEAAQIPLPDTAASAPPAEPSPPAAAPSDPPPGSAPS